MNPSHSAVMLHHISELFFFLISNSRCFPVRGQFPIQTVLQDLIKHLLCSFCQRCLWNVKKQTVQQKVNLSVWLLCLRPMTVSAEHFIYSLGRKYNHFQSCNFRNMYPISISLFCIFPLALLSLPASFLKEKPKESQQAANLSDYQKSDVPLLSDARKGRWLPACLHTQTHVYDKNTHINI